MAPDQKFEPRSGNDRAGAPYSTKSLSSSTTTVVAVWFDVAYDQRLFDKLSTVATMQVFSGRERGEKDQATPIERHSQTVTQVRLCCMP